MLCSRMQRGVTLQSKGHTSMWSSKMCNHNARTRQNVEHWQFVAFLVICWHMTHAVANMSTLMTRHGAFVKVVQVTGMPSCLAEKINKAPQSFDRNQTQGTSVPWQRLNKRCFSPLIGSKDKAHHSLSRDSHNPCEVFQSMYLFADNQTYRLVCGVPLGIMSHQQLSHFQGICLYSQVKRGDVLHFTSQHLQVTPSFSCGTFNKSRWMTACCECNASFKSLHFTAYICCAQMAAQLYAGPWNFMLNHDTNAWHFSMSMQHSRWKSCILREGQEGK